MSVQCVIGKTDPMKVANTGFMLDRLGQDCAPLQFLRELTQNSIEAILDDPDNPTRTGNIVWDVDWATYELTKQYKLCIIDTGRGMTGDEQRRYINQLSSSVHLQSHDGNFGVGAKIAAATRNPEGLIYLSWHKGQGSMLHLWRDPDSGDYGLKPYTVGGLVKHVCEIDDQVKPAEIGDHGTKVVLLGERFDQNTMVAPPQARTPTKWITRYLNTRYFSIPEGITLKVREGYDYPRTDTDRHVLRRIQGQEQYLNSHAEAKGVVPLTSARAHWWILRDESALTSNSGVYASQGHMAALYKNELYDLREANAGYARLQMFGIYLAFNRVVIYVEPLTSDEVRIVANTSRTDLLMNNEPLPWADWAAEFRSNTPAEISLLMEQVSASADRSNHRESIRERLKRILDFLRLSRYRRTPAGTEQVDGEVIGGDPKARDSEPKNKDGGGGGKGGRGGTIYSLFVKPEGDPAEAVLTDAMPEVMWVSIADGTRIPSMLEDRAAKYILENNMLQINSDFRVFSDMIDHWHAHYSDVPGSRAAIEQVVKEWFEQALIEAVMGVLMLKDSERWTHEDLAKAWSEEALTAVVLVRYHINESVKRLLGQRIGSLKRA